MALTPHKILVIINEVEKIKPLLHKAVSLCREHHSLMEILFVHENAPFSLPEYFHHEVNILDQEAVKKEITHTLAALDYNEKVALFVEEEDTLHRVQALCEHQKDLFLLSFYHEKISLELSRALSFPNLVIKTESKDYTDILYIVDMNEDNQSSITSVQALFPQGKVRLLFEHSYFIENYVFDTDFSGMSIGTGMEGSIDQEILDKQKETFKKLKAQTGLEGDFVEAYEEDLLTYVKNKDADLVILHSQNNAFLLEDTLSSELVSSLSSDILVLKD